MMPAASMLFPSCAWQPMRAFLLTAMAANLFAHQLLNPASAWSARVVSWRSETSDCPTMCACRPLIGAT